LDENKQFYLEITATAVKLSLTEVPPAFLLFDDEIIRNNTALTKLPDLMMHLKKDFCKAKSSQGTV
jgi:hypothetical protein